MKARPSVEKRRKELQRQERKREKATRRAERKTEKANGPRPDDSLEPGTDDLEAGADAADIEDGPESASGVDKPPAVVALGSLPSSDRNVAGAAAVFGTPSSSLEKRDAE